MGMVKFFKAIWEITLICLIVFSFMFVIAWLSAKREQDLSYIGKKIIVNKDTLIVTGTSYRGYELSNGAACNFKYLENNIINECK